jgi:hypothetical protein
VSTQPSKPKTIPIASLEWRVLRALFPKDGVGNLTQWEKRLLDKYYPRLTLDRPRLPGGYLPRGLFESPHSLTGQLREDLDHARYREERMIYQWERVDQWFEDHGFDPRAEEIDRDGFERAFAKSFPNAVTKQDAAPKIKSTAEWIEDDIKNLKTEGKLRNNIKITELAQTLANRMPAAVKAGHIHHKVGWRHIKNELPGRGLWPLSKIK